MKIESLIIAASLALVPATTAFAGDDKKEALKKAKEDAKAKAKEDAKEKAKEKLKEKAEKVVEKVKDAKEAKAAADADAKTKAADEEKAAHAKNMGVIERVQQIADATKNADLTALVAKLKEKEDKRHKMATEG